MARGAGAQEGGYLIWSWADESQRNGCAKKIRNKLRSRMLCVTKYVMTESDYASRQLRVIRSLMERATIYRFISAPTALVGGLLSFGGFATAYYAKHHRHGPLSPTEFLIVWLVILALTAFTNLVFLSRG